MSEVASPLFELLSPTPVTPERTVVLGSRGVIGKPTVEALLARGMPVQPVPSSTLDLLADDAAERLAGLLRPGDALVMNSALTPDKGRDAATLIKNLRMAEAVCAAIRAAPPAHVVYVSSDAVYGWGDGLVSEATPPSPNTLYGTMHLAREIMLAEACGPSVPLAIVRCTMILAADDTHFAYGPNRFLRQARAEGCITLAGGGEETRDHVAVEDVARLFVEILRHRGRGVLNAVSGVSVSFAEVARMVTEALPGKIEIASAPRSLPITHRQFDTALLRRCFPSFSFTSLDAAIATVANHGAA
jgi:nucleoside-diphosphate-sugar epimerase